MAIFKNTFDGSTNGVGMTVGNTGGASGNAFTAVEPAAIFSSGWSRSGALSMKLPSTAVTGYGRWSTTGTATKNAAYRFYTHMSEEHTGDFFLSRLEVNGSNASNVILSPANQLRLRIGATNAWTAASSFPTGVTVRVEALYEVGVAADDGRARVAYYLGDSLTAVEDSGWIENLALMGDTGNVTNARFGKSSAGAYDGDAYLDDITLATASDYTGSFLGPDVISNTEPVADAGLDQVVLPGATVALSGAGTTDADGDPLSYAWAFIWPTTGAPALTGATTITPSFTAGPVGSIYAVRLTVSDGIDTATDTVNVSVLSGVGGIGRLVFDGTTWK